MGSEIESAVLEDYDLNEICRQENFEFTRLSEMVRTHYLQYLEKQLNENFLKWHQYHQNMFDLECYKEPIKKAVKILEEGAVKACMIAQLYQRAMLKIISGVKHQTQEKRLVKSLEELITESQRNIQNNHKSTQTQNDLTNNNESSWHGQLEETPRHAVVGNLENNTSLEQKIVMFHKHVYKENADKAACEVQRTRKPRKRKKQSHDVNFYTDSCINNSVSPICIGVSPIASPSLIQTGIRTASPLPGNSVNETKDNVALELARMFSEEKTELDEIFGIDPNGEPDDPQICSILKEIQNAKIHVEDKPQNDISQSYVVSESMTMSVGAKATTPPIPNANSRASTNHLQQVNVDLSKSLWPCELFMQKRKLSESLTRLVDEDFRWVDIIRWKFSQLFGDDSDDEFAPCSPSIDLNEVLLSSCVRRISPWVVKYLMKPMKDGLIGNRYLFKKLAKQLARSIIMENQYPDESIVKVCVENLFCLHRAILSVDDLRDLPNLSSLEC